MRGFRLKKEHLRALLGALLFYAIDALTKAYVIHHLAPGESLPLFPGVLQLTRLHNTGAAFSLFYQHPEILTVVAGGLFAMFLWYMLSKRTLSTPESWGFALVLGGAFGNLVDRIRFGAVTDFLDLTVIHYPVFNLADSFILIGMVLLVMEYVKQHHQTACT